MKKRLKSIKNFCFCVELITSQFSCVHIWRFPSEHDSMCMRNRTALWWNVWRCGLFSSKTQFLNVDHPHMYTISIHSCSVLENFIVFYWKCRARRMAATVIPCFYTDSVHWAQTKSFPNDRTPSKWASTREYNVTPPVHHFSWPRMEHPYSGPVFRASKGISHQQNGEPTYTPFERYTSWMPPIYLWTYQMKNDDCRNGPHVSYRVDC